MKHTKLLLFSLIFGLAGCGTSGGGAGAPPAACNCLPTPAAKVVNRHPGPGKLVILGDSLAHGHGAFPGSMNTPENCLWHNFSFTGTANYSMDGQTSDGTMQAVDAAIADRPSVVFVSTGGNDVLHEIASPGSYPEQSTMTNLEYIFAKLQNSGALVVLLGLNPPDVRADRLRRVWDMATKHGVVVVDGMKNLWLDRSKMSDTIHPNDAGYAIMCQRIVDAVKIYYP